MSILNDIGTKIGTKIKELDNKIVSGSGASGFKNQIINGGFNIWQRGTSFNNVIGYTADRWTINRNECSISYSETAFSNHGIYKSVVITNENALTEQHNFHQPIEHLKRFSGKVLTRSFWIKSSVDTVIKSIYTYYYDSDSNEYSELHTHELYANVWTKIIVTDTLPDFGAANKTFGQNHYLDYIIILPKGMSASTLEISNVQLEEGSVSTSFEQRPIGLELSLCQRYYETGWGWLADGDSSNGNVHVGNVNYKVSKRAAATWWNGTLYHVNGGTSRSGTLNPRDDINGGYVHGYFTSDSGYSYFFNWTADAEL